jgi:hypothetical protein
MGDRCRRSDVGEFAQALDTRRVHVVVYLRHQDDLDLLDVGVDRDHIVGKVVVDVARVAFVDLGRSTPTLPDCPAASRGPSLSPRVHSDERKRRYGHRSLRSCISAILNR